jgi:hypothetical protein
MIATLVYAALALTGALAAPINCRQAPPAASTGSNGLTAAQLLTVAPTSSSCAETVECRTAEQAAPFISKSFTDYAITSKAEQAALIGIMAFESVEFKFNTQQAGNPGQGTRNMQNAPFNVQFAQSVPQLAPQLAAIGTSNVNAVRALVLPDEFSFASAAWFLTSQCSPQVRTALQTGSQDGWAQYITQCVGTEPGPRQAYWQAAVKALA